MNQTHGRWHTVELFACFRVCAYAPSFVLNYRGCGEFLRGVDPPVVHCMVSTPICSGCGQ